MMQMVRPAAITDNGGSFQRASVAWYFDSAGVLQQAAINAPRYYYDPVTLKPLGVAIEDAVTNYITNSAVAGAVAGTPGTVPTNWNFSLAAGLSWQITAVGTEDGIPYVEARISGTAAGTSWIFFPGSMPAVAGEKPVLSVFARLMAGSFANTNGFGVYLDERAGATWLTGGAAQFTPTAAALRTQRNSVTWPFTSPSADTASGYLSWGSSGAVDFTLRIALPQLEKEAVTTPILTTAGTVTRAADQNTLQLLSNIAEPKTGTDFDPAVWSNATPYATGAQVSRLTTHKIYQRINAATPVADAALPEADATKWVEVSSTNKWRMFDQANESQSSIDSLLVAVLRPGTVADTVGLLNVEGVEARCIVPGTPYDVTINLTTRIVSNWLEYFTEPFDTKPDAVFTGLPLRSANQPNIIVSNPGGVARVGNCIIGRSKDIGGVQFGATAGIIDYSQKKTNDFGYTTVVKRAFSKRMNVALLVNADKVDDLQRLLAEYRATPVLWVGAGSLYGALIVYGFYRSFEIVIAYPRQSLCNMQIEGIA